MMRAPSWLRVFFLFFFGKVSLTRKSAHSFSNDFQRHSSRRWKNGSIGISSTRCRMVRNIDMVEALIFYGTASIFYPIVKTSDDTSSESDKGGDFLPGVQDLIEECKRDETSVIAILHDNKDIPQCSNDDNTINYKTETSPAPNPRDLWEAIQSIQIQPKGFGGSSGFGRKAADPERSPLPARCVVLCDTVAKCRAARFAGMRVLCLTDNELGEFEFAWASSTNQDA